MLFGLLEKLKLNPFKAVELLVVLIEDILLNEV
jgi:hypothetical protein